MGRGSIDTVCTVTGIRAVKMWPIAGRRQLTEARTREGQRGRSVRIVEAFIASKSMSQHCVHRSCWTSAGPFLLSQSFMEASNSMKQ